MNDQDPNAGLQMFADMIRDGIAGPVTDAIKSVADTYSVRDETYKVQGQDHYGMQPSPELGGANQLVEALRTATEAMSLHHDNAGETTSPNTYELQGQGYGVQGDTGTYGLQPLAEQAARTKAGFDQLLIAGMALTDAQVEAKGKLTDAAPASLWTETKAALSGFGSMIGQTTGTLAGMVGMAGPLRAAIAGVSTIWAGAKQVVTGSTGNAQSSTSGQTGANPAAALNAIAPAANPAAALNAIAPAAQQAAASLAALSATARAFTPSSDVPVRDAAGSVLPPVANKPLANPGGGAPSVPEPAEEAGGAGGMIGAALGGLGAMAAGIGMVVSALNGIVQASVQFVSALAPSTVQAMQLAMRDLQATIGEALLPIIQVATGVFREIGAMLLPVMEQLQPVIATLANVIGQEVIAVFSALAEVMTGLMPVFDALQSVWEAGLAVFKALVAIVMAVLMPVVNALANAFEMLKPVLQVLTAWIEGVALVWQTAANIFRALAETWQGFLKSLMPAVDAKSWVDGIRSAFQSLSKYLLLASVAIADFIGAVGFRANLLKALGGPEKKNAAGKAAATDVQFKSFQQLGQDVAASALIASGTLGEKKGDPETAWRTDVLKAIQSLDKNELETNITKAITPIADAIVRAIKEGATGAAWEGIKSVGEFHAGLVSKGVSAITGGLLGG